MNTDFIAFRYEPPVITPADGDCILLSRQFYEDKMIGSFFSCVYKGALRIHIVFDMDTDAYHEKIAELIDRTLKQVSLPGKIWTGNENKKIIDFLMRRYNAAPDPEIFHYESFEYRMPREKFVPPARQDGLEVKPYEEGRIDAYLKLLNEAMSFFIPHQDFLAGKPQYIMEFRRFHESGTFRAFWAADTLAGLYWLEGNEIDTIAISPALQRRGYGGIILSHAIQRVFQLSDSGHAVLYCVGWNHTAQSFYQKFGMELYTRHTVRYTPEEESEF